MSFNVTKDAILNNLVLLNEFKIPNYNTLSIVGDNESKTGNIILETSTNTFYGHNGITWVSLSSSSVNIENVGTGIDILVSNMTPIAQLRTLISMSNTIDIGFNPMNSDEISLDLNPLSVSVTNIGTGTGLYNGGILPNPFEFRSLVSNDGSIRIESDSSGNINLESLGGSPVVIQNVGSGVELYVDGSGSPFEFRSLINKDVDLSGSVGVVDTTVYPDRIEFYKLASRTKTINTSFQDNSGIDFISIDAFQNSNVENLIIYVDGSGNDANDVIRNESFEPPAFWENNVNRQIFSENPSIDAYENSTQPIQSIDRAFEIAKTYGWNRQCVIVLGTTKINVDKRYNTYDVGIKGTQDLPLTIIGQLEERGRYNVGRINLNRTFLDASGIYEFTR